jgi:flagellar basal-body rod protein FlgF
MADLMAIAATILSDASRTVEVSAQNVANMTTPGYKRRTEFAQLLAAPADSAAAMTTARQTAIDFSSGKLVETDNPYDLALTGEGMFAVRTPQDSLLYTRAGQFTRDAEGRLVDAQGAALQADGRDLVLTGAKVEVQKDGVVLEDGAPTARLDLMRFTDRAAATPAAGGAFSAPAGAMEAASEAGVRQGATEMSNVSTAAEMVSIMGALRRAETGQRLVTVYDDLMGRAISTFGQAG